MQFTKDIWLYDGVDGVYRFKNELQYGMGCNVLSSSIFNLYLQVRIEKIYQIEKICLLWEIWKWNWTLLCEKMPTQLYNSSSPDGLWQGTLYKYFMNPAQENTTLLIFTKKNEMVGSIYIFWNHVNQGPRTGVQEQNSCSVLV